MKSKWLLIGLLSLFILASYSISIQAATDYEISVKDGDELIWTLNTLNSDSMADIWGNDWDDADFWKDGEVGAQMKMEIGDIDDGVEGVGGKDFFTIEIKCWYWNDHPNEGWGDEDWEDDVGSIEKPDDYKDVYGDNYKSSFNEYSWIFPTPTDQYFDEMQWEDNVDIEGSKATIEYEDGDYAFGGLVDEDIKIIFVYGGNGVLQNAKLLDSDDAIVLEYSLAGIPGYELPILLGITVVFSIGLIYIIRKKY